MCRSTAVQAARRFEPSTVEAGGATGAENVRDSALTEHVRLVQRRGTRTFGLWGGKGRGSASDVLGRLAGQSLAERLGIDAIGRRPAVERGDVGGIVELDDGDEGRRQHESELRGPLRREMTLTRGRG